MSIKIERGLLADRIIRKENFYNISWNFLGLSKEKRLIEEVKLYNIEKLCEEYLNKGQYDQDFFQEELENKIYKVIKDIDLKFKKEGNE
jgi:hypothetical protein